MIYIVLWSTRKLFSSELFTYSSLEYFEYIFFRQSKYWLPWLVGMPAETATAICSLLMGGILHNFPKLKVSCFLNFLLKFHPFTGGHLQLYSWVGFCTTSLN